MLDIGWPLRWARPKNRAVQLYIPQCRAARQNSPNRHRLQAIQTDRHAHNPCRGANRGQCAANQTCVYSKRSRKTDSQPHKQSPMQETNRKSNCDRFGRHCPTKIRTEPKNKNRTKKNEPNRKIRTEPKFKNARASG